MRQAEKKKGPVNPLIEYSVDPISGPMHTPIQLAAPFIAVAFSFELGNKIIPRAYANVSNLTCSDDESI